MKLNSLLTRRRCSTLEMFYNFELKDNKLSRKIHQRTKEFILDNLENFKQRINISEKYSLEDLIEDKGLRISCENNEKKKIDNFALIFANYATASGRITLNPKKTVTFKGYDVEVSCDILLESPIGTYAINLVNTTPLLSTAARKEENKPVNSLELYMLTLLAEDYSDNGTGAFIYLKGKTNADQTSILTKNFVTFPESILSTTANRRVVNDKFTNEVLSILQGDLKCESCDDCKFRYYCMNNKRVLGKELDEDENKGPVTGKFLTKDQMKVVTFNEGYSRVSAGPGAGKTMTIVERFANLVMNGEDPDKILMITFTNAACEEMKDRLYKTLKENGLPGEKDDLNIYTFNSLGQKMIEDNYKFFGYKEKPAVLNKVDKLDLVYESFAYVLESAHPEILERFMEEGFDMRNAFFSTFNYKGAAIRLAEIFEVLKRNSVKSIMDFKLLNHKERLVPDNLDIATWTVYTIYQNELIKKNKLDYADQLMQVTTAFDNNSKFIRAYEFHHIIVDEFQDTSFEQMDFLKHLTKMKNFKSLMVVGDAAQSIYGFRGTTPKNMINLNRVYPNLKDFNLLENFRSTKEIVRFSNWLESLNYERLKRECYTNNEDGDEIEIFNDSDRYLIENLQKELKKYDYKDIAILARTKKELSLIADILDANKIPYDYGYNEPIFLHKFLPPVLSFAKFVQNLENTRGAMEYLALTGEIDEFMDMTQINLKVEMLKNDVFEKLKDKMDADLEEGKISVFKEYINKIQDEPFKEFVNKVILDNHFMPNIISFLEKSIEYKNDDIIEIEEPKRNSITLTTAHSSKGKEWDVVYIFLDKFRLPRAIKDDPRYPEEEKLRNDEERRLFYVAATRARKVLKIFSNKYAF